MMAVLLLLVLPSASVSTSEEFRAALRSQDTEIVLNDGIYTGQFDLARSGVTIRAKNQWKAWIDPAGGYGDGLDLGSGSDIVVDGLRITGARTIGIRSSGGRRVTIRNCRVECCMVQGILIYGTGHTIEYNLLQRNGLNGLHHGLYISGSGHVVTGNVVRDNSGYGIHGYPSIENSIVSFNSVSGHPVKSGILVFNGGGNFVLHNAAWKNRMNIDVRSSGNRVMGNAEVATDSWPLSTRPE